MKIAIIGTGYVGFTAGACFAYNGNDVTCVDVDAAKVEMLNSGILPIYEEELDDVVSVGLEQCRLKFTTDYVEACRDADVVFLTVGTPTSQNGYQDTTCLMDAALSVRDALRRNTKAIVVVKSTVVPGTTMAVARVVGRPTLYNPEFLREGHAVDDFMFPDRIVLGADGNAHAVSIVSNLYEDTVWTKDVDPTILCMSTRSAEMSKYASNAMLATRISFVNELGSVCNKVGADIREVTRAMGLDKRIGEHFLEPGLGYGGSCFPKDIRALRSFARNNAVEPHLMNAVERANEAQQMRVFEQIRGRVHTNGTLAMWGVAFKPGTDDVRESPAMGLVFRFLARSATEGMVSVYDPKAAVSMMEGHPPSDRLVYCIDKYDALWDADMLVIAVDWDEFKYIDVGRMTTRMRSAEHGGGQYILDCRINPPAESVAELEGAFNYITLFGRDVRCHR